MDEKNRVSVPAQFRNIIEATGENIIYAYPSLINQCLEVCTTERINYLAQHIESFDLFSDEREALSTAILSGCEAMQIDAKGRVSLSERLLAFTGITNEIAFVGKGKTFEIWHKQYFDSYFSNAREAARNKSLFQKRNNLNNEGV